MYQRIILAGNLGADPIQKYTPDGKAVTTFSVATSRRYKDKTETTWFRCTVWGERAEFVSEHFHKGSGIIVEGKLTPDKETGAPKVFQRKDGTYGASYEVEATSVDFPPKNGNSDNSSEDVAY